jgi:hypothetical protein
MRTAVPYLLTTLLIPGAIGALEFSLIGGSEFDTLGQSFYYTGLTTAKPLKKWRLMGRLWLDHLTYRFSDGNGNITARSPSFQVGGGIGYLRGNWRVNLFASYENRRVEVVPDVPDVKVKGTYSGIALQGELYGGFSEGGNLSMILNYSAPSSYLWGMVSLGRTFVTGKLFLGIEAIGQGNPDYRAFQAGLRAGLTMGGFFTGVRGGYKESSTGRGAYGGLEVYLGF